jgi:fucose 4-O-acetylase-like acetyltransferase
VLMIWIGIIMVFILAQRVIHCYPSWLLLVGKNTLVIYMLNNFVSSACRRVLQMIGIGVNPISALFICAATVAICCVVSNICKKVFSICIYGSIPKVCGPARLRTTIRPHVM